MDTFHKSTVVQLYIYLWHICIDTLQLISMHARIVLSLDEDGRRSGWGKQLQIKDFCCGSNFYSANAQALGDASAKKKVEKVSQSDVTVAVEFKGKGSAPVETIWSVVWWWKSHRICEGNSDHVLHNLKIFQKAKYQKSMKNIATIRRRWRGVFSFASFFFCCAHSKALETALLFSNKRTSIWCVEFEIEIVVLY